MPGKMIVAYDGSPQSEKAYAFALDMATRYDAGLLVLSVARPPEPPVAVEMQAVLDTATDYYQSRFKALEEQARAVGIAARFLVRVGHPADQIVRLADEEKADAIVMGHRSGGLLNKWLLGSVAKRVMSYAPCTVVIVR